MLPRGEGGAGLQACGKEVTEIGFSPAVPASKVKEKFKLYLSG